MREGLLISYSGKLSSEKTFAFFAVSQQILWAEIQFVGVCE